MSRVLTTDGLIRAVRTRGAIPSDTATYTDDVIIDVLNEEIDTGLLSSILSVSEEYLVNYTDVPIVSGTIKYKIPYRAVGNKLRDVFLVDHAGNVYECTRISLEDISGYQGNQISDYSHLNQFYVENDGIVIRNTQLSNFAAVRFYYYLRPSKLVKESAACQITAIDTNTGVISVSNLPTTFSSLPQIDFVANKTPNKIISFDKAITNVSINSNPKTITLSPSLIPSDLAVGDWICKAEETPIPNIPTEWQPVLAQRAAVYLMESMGDTEGLNNAKAKLEKIERSVMELTDNRVEGAPQKILNRNGLLSGRSRYKFRR